MVNTSTQTHHRGTRRTKLTSETSKAKGKGLPIVAVRSGFFALPTASGSWIYVRRHRQHEIDLTVEDTQVDTISETRLFVDGLPIGTTRDDLGVSFGKLYSAADVIEIQMISNSDSTDATTLFRHELTAAEHNTHLMPLFASTSANQLEEEVAVREPISSAIITFSEPVQFPPFAVPPAFLPSHSSTSFVTRSAKRYNVARPHLSAVIAHSDSWMASYDKRKIKDATTTIEVSNQASINNINRENTSEKSLKKKKKTTTKQKNISAGPLPGSAAYALAQHQATLAKHRDPSHNPDELQEEEWTLVTRGGKHGKSLLPSGVTITPTGYGNATVKVARAGKRGRVVESKIEDGPGMKKIVGDGFYTFKREESRRADLSALKARFEEDKIRLGQYRSSSSARRGQHGNGTGKYERKFKPY